MSESATADEYGDDGRAAAYFHLAARAAFCRYLRFFSCLSVFCCSSSFACLFFFALITAPPAPSHSLSLRGLLLIYKVIAALPITTTRSSRGGGSGRGSSFNQKQQQQKTQFPIKSAKCSIEANFYGRPTPSPCLSLHLLPSSFCHSDHSFNNCFCLLPAVIVVGSLFMYVCVCGFPRKMHNICKL